MSPGKRRQLDNSLLGQLQEEVERLKAQIRARGEHAFRVVKRQFGYAKVRYRGLAKNTAQLHMLFALANVWMARGKLLSTG
jgi:IS5 family transposase